MSRVYANSNSINNSFVITADNLKRLIQNVLVPKYGSDSPGKVFVERGWHPYFDNDGICKIETTKSNHDINGDWEFFESIAPYVASGSYLWFFSDSNVWVYYFDRGIVTEYPATLWVPELNLYL